MLTPNIDTNLGMVSRCTWTSISPDLEPHYIWNVCFQIVEFWSSSEAALRFLHCTTSCARSQPVSTNGYARSRQSLNWSFRYQPVLLTHPRGLSKWMPFSSALLTMLAASYFYQKGLSIWKAFNFLSNWKAFASDVLHCMQSTCCFGVVNP